MSSTGTEKFCVFPSLATTRHISSIRERRSDIVKVKVKAQKQYSLQLLTF